MHLLIARPMKLDEYALSCFEVFTQAAKVYGNITLHKSISPVVSYINAVNKLLFIKLNTLILSVLVKMHKNL